MELEDFSVLIQELPIYQQSFTTKRDVWPAHDRLDYIFDGADVLTLNRFDVRNEQNLEDQVLKTLLWGYSTGGRGNNIENLLEPSNFILLLKKLEVIKISGSVNIQQITELENEIKFLGLSTISKLLYFMNIMVEGYPANIFDSRIVNILNAESFNELKHLSGITTSNAIAKYPQYLKTLVELAQTFETSPARIEFFLYMFGQNLSELKEEKCYDKI